MELGGIASLTPEERQALKEALDKAETSDPVDEVCELVEYLCDEVNTIKEQMASLQKLVTDDIVGGIKEAYESNEKSGRMDAFKGKYGTDLDSLAEPFKKTFGQDLHESAFNYIDGKRGEEGFDGDGEMQSIIQQIKEKLRLGEPAAAVAEVKEEAPAAPAAEGEAEEEPEADAQKAWDEIAQMKKRDDAKAAQKEKNKPIRKGA